MYNSVGKIFEEAAWVCEGQTGKGENKKWDQKITV